MAYVIVIVGGGVVVLVVKEVEVVHCNGVIVG